MPDSTGPTAYQAACRRLWQVRREIAMLRVAEDTCLRLMAEYEGSQVLESQRIAEAADEFRQTPGGVRCKIS
jgi:hypothetical protein